MKQNHNTMDKKPLCPGLPAPSKGSWGGLGGVRGNGGRREGEEDEKKERERGGRRGKELTCSRQKEGGDGEGRGGWGRSGLTCIVTSLMGPG